MSSRNLLQTRQPCILALEDGTVFSGLAFGAAGTRTGEVVFNTAMTGYQEILTDPSYYGQIVTMTCPHIGNYGVNAEDIESSRPHVAGFIVREFAARASNHRATRSLEEYLIENDIVGIEGIDTRALTRKLRVDGAMRGVLTTDVDPNQVDASGHLFAISGPRAQATGPIHNRPRQEADPPPHRVTDFSDWVRRARETPSMLGADLVRFVAPGEPSIWTKGLDAQFHAPRPRNKTRPRVAAIDCGMKRNILRHLVDLGCEVHIVPPTWSPDQVLALAPDGLFVSNGPGDPAAVHYAVELLRGLIGKLPIFGICLGHQLLALALGATSFKLKFGHRGANQPVKNATTGRVEITSQNHGFAIDTASLEAVGGTPTHINLNDNTLEGFIHREMPILAVQYHPEAGPGPHDAAYLFDCFATMMTTGRAPTPDEMSHAQSALQQRTATT